MLDRAEKDGVSDFLNAVQPGFLTGFDHMATAFVAGDAVEDPVVFGINRCCDGLLVHVFGRLTAACCFLLLFYS